MFSGGLDSLAGVVDRLANGRGRLTLVSHQSSTKIAKRQRDLVEELKLRFPNRILHVPVRANTLRRKTVEPTQRTRSLLFGAIGAAVAQSNGTNQLTLFENGVVSINLPVAGQIVGAAASRTTHPKVLHDLSTFLTVVLGRPFEVKNPYIWKTKAEVIGILKEGGHSDLARRTISCSRVRDITVMHTHCGCCSQCLDRRFGAMGAGLGENDPREMYAIDLLADGRETPADRTMAEAFVLHALGMESLSDLGFMGKFAGEVARVIGFVPGRGADDVARAIFDLHRRHAKNVRQVLSDGYKQYAAALAGQQLPESCLLRLIAGPKGLAPFAAASPETLSAAPDGRDFSRLAEIRIAVDKAAKTIRLGHDRTIEGPAAFELVSALVEVALKDVQDLLAPENHRYVEGRLLAEQLGVTEESLRRCVLRVRQRVADVMVKDAGISTSANAMIESAPRKGYRLNPAVVVVSPTEVARSARHAPGGGASRLSAARAEKSAA